MTFLKVICFALALKAFQFYTLWQVWSEKRQPVIETPIFKESYPKPRFDGISRFAQKPSVVWNSTPPDRRKIVDDQCPDDHQAQTLCACKP